MLGMVDETIYIATRAWKYYVINFFFVVKREKTGYKTVCTTLNYWTIKLVQKYFQCGFIYLDVGIWVICPNFSIFSCNMLILFMIALEFNREIWYLQNVSFLKCILKWIWKWIILRIAFCLPTLQKYPFFGLLNL